MPEPNPAHPAARDRYVCLAQFVGDTVLTKGGLFNGEGDHSLLERRIAQILEYRLLSD